MNEHIHNTCTCQDEQADFMMCYTTQYGYMSMLVYSTLWY